MIMTHQCPRQVLLATCFDGDALAAMRALEGRHVSVMTNPAGDISLVEGAGGRVQWPPSSLELAWKDCQSIVGLEAQPHSCDGTLQ